MRFLMRIVIPTAAENPVAGDPQLEDKLNALYRSVGGLQAYSRNEKGRRVDYVLIDISDMKQIKVRAKRVFEALNVKTGFYPQKAAEPLFGV